MFGTFRLMLAAMVVWTHFFDGGFAGSMAVFGFYCLSGYLMTMIINGPYSDGLNGYLRYLGNRALRIYPIYLVAAGITAGIILFWAAGGSRFDVAVFEPQYLIPNLTIIGHLPGEPAFIPPVWTLHVELLHYIAIGALLGRSRFATVGWFVAALQLRLFGPWGGLPLEWFYWTPVGSSLAFATGAMVWHFRDALPKPGIGSTVIVAALFVLTSGLMDVRMGLSGGLNIAIALAAVIIIGLRNLPANKIDTLLGDLAYPLYLLHSPVVAIVRGAAGHRDLMVDTLGMAVTVALSWLAVVAIDRPISRIRAALRYRDANHSVVPGMALEAERH